MSDTECQLRELQTALAAKDAMILAIADRLAICSALLSRWAERPEFRRPAWHNDAVTEPKNEPLTGENDASEVPTHPRPDRPTGAVRRVDHGGRDGRRGEGDCPI